MICSPPRSNRHSSHILSFLWSLVCLLLAFPVFAGHDHDDPEKEPCKTEPQAAILDPSRYLILELDGDPIHAPGGEPENRKWILPPRGELKIDFHREAMKKAWDFNTRSELSIHGSVSDKDGGERAIEIPGYAQVGKQLQLVQLNLHSAREVIQQLYQGSRFAHRIVAWDKEAKLAGLEALDKAKCKEAQAKKKALTNLQAELRCTEDCKDPEEDVALRTAGAVSRAFARYNTIGVGDVELKTSTEKFFARLEAEPIGEWVEHLTAKEKRLYLVVIAQVIDRNEQVILDSAKQIDTALKQDKQKLSPGELDAVRELVVTAAERLIQVEDDLYHHYADLSERRWAELTSRCSALPKGFSRQTLELPPAAFIVDAICKRCGGADCTSTKQPGDTEFDCQAAEDPEAIRRMGRIAELREELRNQRYFGTSLECADERRALDALTDGMQVLLAGEVIEDLIDKISPTIIDLSALGLERFDTLRLEVSLLPTEGDDDSIIPAQQTFAFSIQPHGWHAPLPKIKDNAVMLVRGKGGEYKPGSGVTAVWNFYGRGQKPGTAWRTLAPGFGFSTVALDFDDSSGDDEMTMDGAMEMAMNDSDDESIEIGIGLTFTLFDNMLSLTWGRNLMAQQNGSHEFWAVGISVQEVIDKFKKD